MLGANQMNITSGNTFRSDIWSKELTRATEANLVLADKVSRFDADSKGAKSVYIPKISNLVAYNKVANTAVALQNPTETSTNLLLDKHKYCAFLLEDYLKIQQNYSLLSEYSNKAGYAIAKAMDTDIATLATGFSQTKGTYNTTITTTVMVDSVQELDDEDVPADDRCWVLKPHAVADLRTISDYIRFDGTGFAGGTATGALGNGKKGAKGLVGMLFGSPVYQTTQIQQTSNDISNMYFHREAIALGVQQEVRIQNEYKLEYLGELVVADISYGVIERRDEFGLELKN